MTVFTLALHIKKLGRNKRFYIVTILFHYITLVRVIEETPSYLHIHNPVVLARCPELCNAQSSSLLRSNNVRMNVISRYWSSSDNWQSWSVKTRCRIESKTELLPTSYALLSKLHSF